MRTIQKNEKGFSAVEALIILVIVVLIGGVGYLIYKNHHKAAAPLAVTVTKTTTTKPAPAVTWKTYSNQQAGFTFQYPASWVNVATPEPHAE